MLNAKIQKSAANAIAAAIGNLNYVKIDHSAAVKHWGVMCEGIQMMRDGVEHMGAYFYRDNIDVLLRQKLVAGIVGHRKQGQFYRHKLKERILLRRIAGKRT